jgi:ribosome biogenesis protein Tsr3
MEKFKWGPNFFVLNEKPFLLYSQCENSKELGSTADEYLKSIT